MAGIFPDNGVTPDLADNAYEPEETPGISCPPKYYSSNCAQTLDVDGLNAMISEMASFVDLIGPYPWDCTKLTNMADALGRPPAQWTMI